MCLESSKQSFTLYKALLDAGEDGYIYSTLIQKMQDVSQVHFASRMYVYNPVPLDSLIKFSLKSQEVAVSKAGKLHLTRKGKVILNHLKESEEIEGPTIPEVTKEPALLDTN